MFPAEKKKPTEISIHKFVLTITWNAFVDARRQIKNNQPW